MSRDNNHTFNTLAEVHQAVYFWYGKDDLDSCCLAEGRLMRGEVPKYKQTEEDLVK